MSDNIENQNNDNQQEAEKLLNTIHNVRKERDEFKKKLKDLESKLSAIDLDKYQELIQKEAESEEKELETSRAYDKLKSKWNKERGDLRVNIESLQNEIKNTNTVIR
jgi:chromosome segregation ATPase